MNKAIYLDHQASTPLSPASLAAMIPVLSDAYGNPHSMDHAIGWAAADTVEAARAKVADAIGALAEEVVFTSGATEANNLAILGIAEGAGRPGPVVVSAIEHKSVLAAARSLAASGRELRVVPVDPSGRLDMRALDEALTDEVVVASIGLVNSEIGVVQDLASVAELCRNRGVPLHTDATQALAWRGLDVEALGVDFASVSAHKVGGPQGIGALFVAGPAGDRIVPVLHGGGQEGGLRPGTLPTALCVGFGAACEALPDEAEVGRWRAVTERLLDGMVAAFAGTELNGTSDPRHPGNLNLRLPGVDAEQLVARAQPWLALARGSACTSGIPEPSHVLRAIGLSAEAAAQSVRLSTGPATTPEEVDLAIEILREGRP